VIRLISYLRTLKFAISSLHPIPCDIATLPYRALNWARKYGLRVNLDLHTAPGSQNGWNHSGRLGSIGWLRGVMGLTNAQRSLNHIRTLTEFIMQDQFRNVVPMFSIMNEPSSTAIGAANLRRL
jgi:glucan 1,3-beta-glucosidase